MSHYISGKIEMRASTRASAVTVRRKKEKEMLGEAGGEVKVSKHAAEGRSHVRQ